MDPLTALMVTLSFGGIAGAVYAAQIEARHQRQIGTDCTQQGCQAEQR
jgi:hypothetical protein